MCCLRQRNNSNGLYVCYGVTKVNKMIQQRTQFANEVQKVLVKTCLKIMRPLVRVLLRNGIPYHAASDLLKWSYVEVAKSDFRYAGRKQSKARLSILTGLSRVEVDRVMRRPEPVDDPELALYNRAARVVTGWLEDSDFHEGDDPSTLQVDTVGTGFTELVRRYSGGAPVRAMLDELVRVNAVEFISDTEIRLVSHALIAQSDDHEVEKLAILGVAVNDLLETLDHNIYSKYGRGRFQRVIFSQKVPVEKLGQLRRYAFDEGQVSSDKFDQKLFELSEQEGVSGQTARAGFGIYYFEDSHSDLKK